MAFFKRGEIGSIDDLLKTRENAECLEHILAGEVSLNQKLVKEVENFNDMSKVIKRSKEAFELFKELKPDVDTYLGVVEDKNPGVYVGRIGAIKAAWPIYLPILYMVGKSVGKTAAVLPQVYAATGILGTTFYALPTLMISYLVLNILTSHQNCYHPWFKNINLKKANEEDAKITLAHEYTHFLQHKKVGLLPRAIQEGHARGVQNKIAHKYWEEKNNPWYLVRTNLMNVSELKTGYEWVCKKVDKPRAQWVKKIKISKSRTLLGKPDMYAKGNSLFRIAEEKYPSINIHARILKKDYTHLKI